MPAPWFLQGLLNFIPKFLSGLLDKSMGLLWKRKTRRKKLGLRNLILEGEELLNFESVPDPKKLHEWFANIDAWFGAVAEDVKKNFPGHEQHLQIPPTPEAWRTPDPIVERKARVRHHLG